MSYDDDDDDRYTPAQAMRDTWSWFPVALVVTVALIILGGVIVVVCWAAGWWMFEQNVKHENNVYQNSYGTQQSDIQSMEQAVQAIPGAVDHAQVLGDVNTACAAGARVNQLPPGDASWYAANCSGPAISPSSQYNVNGN